MASHKMASHKMARLCYQVRTGMFSVAGLVLMNEAKASLSVKRLVYRGSTALATGLWCDCSLSLKV